MTSGTAPKEQDPEAAEGLPVAAREASRVTPSAWRFARCQTILLATLVAFSIVLYVYKLGRDSPQCHPAPPARYSDTCPMRGYGWLLPGTSLLLSPVWSDEKRWGNELSVYWNGRGMARLGGLSFAAVGDFHHAWLRYLPLYVPARDPPASCAAFEEACDSCEDWKYSHKCVGAWTHISDEIVADTRAALRKYAGLHGRCDAPRRKLTPRSTAAAKFARGFAGCRPKSLTPVPADGATAESFLNSGPRTL